jgi:hypothetical protein
LIRWLEYGDAHHSLNKMYFFVIFFLSERGMAGCCLSSCIYKCSIGAIILEPKTRSNGIPCSYSAAQSKMLAVNVC